MEVSIIQNDHAKALRQGVLAEIRKAAAEAPRMYFAPLIGAMRAIRTQYRTGGAPARQKPQKQASGQIRG